MSPQQLSYFMTELHDEEPRTLPNIIRVIRAEEKGWTWYKIINRTRFHQISSVRKPEVIQAAEGTMYTVKSNHICMN